MARVAYDGSRNFALADLNWSRLTPWRDMTAEFFDDPVRLPWLSRIRRVEVSFGAEDPGRGNGPPRGLTGRSSAALRRMVGRPPGLDGGGRVGGDGRRSRGATAPEDARRQRGRSPAARPTCWWSCRRGQDPCGPLGGLVGVTLEIHPEVEGTPGALLSVVHSPDGCVCAVRVSEGGSDVLIRTFDVTPLPEDQLLADELDYPGPDPVFEESLLAAASLAALNGSEWFRP